MKDLKKRLLLVSVALMVFGLFSVSAAQAVPYGQTVTAYQGVKILYAGKELTGTTQPYIINNSTYVPLRMLMDNFGDKFIVWDSVGYRVIITDKGTTSVASLQEQIKQKDAEIATLKNQITSLNDRISDLQNDSEDEDTSTSDEDLSDIEDTLSDYIEDAGDDYFNDSGIEVSSFSLSGDEDDISYTVKLDFGDADDYDRLTDASESDIEDFMDAIYNKLQDEVDGTDYEDADITGRLSDKDHTGDYVDYEDGDYDYSWDSSSSSSGDLGDIEDTLSDYFDSVGDDYLADDSVSLTSLTLSGDEDEVTYTIKLDFAGSDYNDLEEVSKNRLVSFLNAVKSKLNSELDGTDYDGAEISGVCKDADHSSESVTYQDGEYSYTW